MNHTLNNQIALVTGASSGIGLATAWELLRHGAHVILVARRTNELNSLADRMNQAGYHATALPADVRDPHQVKQLVSHILEDIGPINILVNNAGVGWETSFTETSIDDMNTVVDTNLRGAMLMTQAVLPTMLQQHRGSLIFVTSVSSHIAVDPLYSASKFGLRGFALALYRELKGSGVSLSVISPGFIRTTMNTHRRQIRLPMPGPEVIATTIVHLIHHPHRETIIPQFYLWLIRLEHLFPWLADIVIHHARVAFADSEQHLVNKVKSGSGTL